MPSEEHIHIVAVGESIHKTLPLALNEFRTTRLVLVVEEALFADPGPPKKDKILDAMESVKKIASPLGISVKTVKLGAISLAEIRDAVLCEYASSRGAKLYFNITGGTKVLSNGLFLMSIWVGGIAYYIDQGEGVQVLNVPRMQIDEVARNPNYLAILRILANPTGERPYKEVLQEMEDHYSPIRQISKKTKRRLQKGTFSKWVRDLLGWGLLVEGQLGTSRRDKTLAITEDGIFTLRLTEASLSNETK